MLATDRIAGIMRRALGPLYEDAILQAYTQDDTRDPARGTFLWIFAASVSVKVQRDDCTEAQRGQDGYTAKDVRFLVLQHGVAEAIIATEGGGQVLTEDGGLLLVENSAVHPNTDYRVIYRNAEYRVMSVSEDPARSYWDFRARLMP